MIQGGFYANFGKMCSDALGYTQASLISKRTVSFNGALSEILNHNCAALKYFPGMSLNWA